MTWLNNEHNRTQTTDGWLEDETDKRTSFQRAFLNQPVRPSAFPWETCVSPGGVTLEEAQNFPTNRPELHRDLLTGLWPGQEHPMDAPDFLNRATNPLATNRRS